MMIYYFRKDLRPSVTVKMEQRGQELKSFKKLVKKAVNAKAKADLRSCFYACKTDQYCFQGSQLFATKTIT